MSVSETLTNLMNAGRRIYGNVGRMSVTDLTNRLSSAYASGTLLVALKADLLKAVNDGLQVASADSSDYATLTLKTTSDINQSENRIYISLPQSIDQTMTAILIARKNSAVTSEKVTLQVGGYENLSTIDISSTDWQAYSIPMKDSVSTFFSIYLRGKETDSVDLKAAILVRPLGVTPTNLIANWTSNLDNHRASFSDGILSFAQPEGGAGSSTDLLFKNGIQLTSGHMYRLSYMARGTGYARTYIYAYNDKKTGDYTDNFHAVQLKDSWQPVIYTFRYNPAVNNPSLAFSFRPGEKDTDARASKGEAADFCLVDISK